MWREKSNSRQDDTGSHEVREAGVLRTVDGVVEVDGNVGDLRVEVAGSQGVLGEVSVGVLQIPGEHQTDLLICKRALS